MLPNQSFISGPYASIPKSHLIIQMTKQNVLLIVLDAVRRDHLSTYGHERQTDPFLATLADESTVFEACFSNSNWTPTSHAAIFTGTLPSHSGVYGSNLTLPTDIRTMAEILSENGYRTFATAAGAHIRADRGFDRGFDVFHETYRIRPSMRYAKQMFSDSSMVKQTARTATLGHDNYTYYKVERLKKWLDAGDDPFFAFVNLKTAHHPYNPPRPYKSKFSNTSRPALEFIERGFAKLGRETLEVPGHDVSRLRALSRTYPIIGGGFTPDQGEADVIRSWYDGAINYLDSKIESMLGHMAEIGVLQNTNVIVTSDHGEMFGEHGLEKHQYSLYEELLRVPLLVRAPDRQPRRVKQMVSLVDLYPTILEMADIHYDELECASDVLDFNNSHEHLYAEVGRKSNRPISRAYPDFRDSEHNGPLQSIRDTQYKLIRSNCGRVELYDWQNDPGEENDLSQSHPVLRCRLEDRLQENLNQMDERTYDEDVSDHRLKQQLKDLGYI